MSVLFFAVLLALGWVAFLSVFGVASCLIDTLSYTIGTSKDWSSFWGVLMNEVRLIGFSGIIKSGAVLFAIVLVLGLLV